MLIIWEYFKTKMKKIGPLERMLHCVKIDKFKKMTLYIVPSRDVLIYEWENSCTFMRDNILVRSWVRIFWCAYAWEHFDVRLYQGVLYYIIKYALSIYLGVYVLAMIKYYFWCKWCKTMFEWYIKIRNAV